MSPEWNCEEAILVKGNIFYRLQKDCVNSNGFFFFVAILVKNKTRFNT